MIELKNNNFVYPIFKNGQTSLFNYAEGQNLVVLKNSDINKLKKIIVFLRDPVSRFVSGVHTVIELEKIKNIKEFLKDVEDLKSYNRHFVPQFYWLMHLFKYFKGSVELLPIVKLYDMIPNRDGPDIIAIDEDRKKRISLINNRMYTEVDHKLMKKYIGKTIQLEQLIREFKNEMS